MTGPIASIIVALIVTLGGLFGFGAFTPTALTYATVNFDGGYKKIGVIAAEEIYTEASISVDGETLKSGTIEDVISWIQKRGKSDGQELSQITYKPGVSVKGEAGIKWIASESNFKLSTDSIDLTSTATNPLKPLEVIEQLKKIRDKSKAERIENAKKALAFSKAPTESFAIAKLLSLIGK